MDSKGSLDINIIEIWIQQNLLARPCIVNMFGYANLRETVKYIKRVRSRNHILKAKTKAAKTGGQKRSAFIQI